MSRILVTGASGFLGSIVMNKLQQSGHILTTIGISETDNVYCDLTTNIPVLNSDYDWVIHIAGKAHSNPKTEEEKQQYFDVNVKGTRNLCAAFENRAKPRSFVFISSVAVYGLDFGENITEESPLLGATPYALSKIQAESCILEWCALFNIIPGVIRPSLLAGKNPPGNLGDMIRRIKNGRYLSIGNGSTKKSVLIAEDIARIIPKIAETGGTYNFCDDHHPSFRELETLIALQLGMKRPLAIPYWCAKCIAIAGDIVGEKFPINSSKLNKLVRPLTFSNEKAKIFLNWQPLDVLSNFRIE